MASVDRWWPRNQRQPVRYRCVESGIPLRNDSNLAARAGFLRGQLEYAVDVVPVWVITQKTNTAYGGSVDPFAFKWILSSSRKVKPFFQIEGGTLFTNTKVPEGTSQINFTTSGGIGAHFLGKKHNFSAEVRFQHISNAGMTNPNPGINTIQLRIGFGAFR